MNASMDNQTAARRYLATAAHHERMAAALESVGKRKDAESAREAARLARASAAALESV